jgi:hypothetical protein
MHICTRLLKLSFSLTFMIYEKKLVISADNINLLITRTDKFDLQRKIINIRRKLEILFKKYLLSTKKVFAMSFH